MFRDSRGVVHTVCSADPLVDLPPGAARALLDALLPPSGAEPVDPSDGGQASDGGVDLGSVLELCDAVRELLERWQDAFFAALPDEVDLVEEGRWAAEAGMSLDELEQSYSEQDELDDASQAEEASGRHEADLDGPGWEPVPFDDELVEPDPDPADPRRVLPEALVAVLERELLLLPVRVRLEALVAGVDLVETWSDLVSDQEKLLGHLVLSHAEPQAVLAQEALVRRHSVLHAGTGPGHIPTDVDQTPTR